jgi:phospholipid/cholesterol/gamma-HCH transport system substrate-binding protein
VRTAIRKHLSDFIALAILVAIAIGVTGYILSQQESRGYFPLIEKAPFELKAEFSDAQAVIPGQGQTVRVAGVEVGKIAKVEPKNGVAVVSMDLNRDMIDNHELVLHPDATAQLRPRTGLKDMFVELDPGSAGPKLKEHATIPVQNTEPDVDPDEILSALDTDTRAYLQLLITGLGKGFAGHGKDLNATYKALGPTNRDLERITRAVAFRKHELARLVHNYADLTNTLADRDADVRRLVDASNATLSAFAQENLNISNAVAQLPSTLQITASTLGKLNTFSQVARPALESLRPAFRQLDVANRSVRPFALEAEPILRTQIRPFVRIARPYINTLRPAARNLAIATPDLTKSIFELNRFFNMAAFNPNGREPVPSSLTEARKRDEGYLFWIAWVSHLTDSLFSTSDAQGPFRRTLQGFSCDTLRQQAAAGVGQAGPLGPGGSAAIFGITDLVAPTGICASGAPPAGGPFPPAKKATPAANGPTAAPPSTTDHGLVPELPKLPIPKTLPTAPQVPNVPPLPQLPTLPGVTR